MQLTFKRIGLMQVRHAFRVAAPAILLAMVFGYFLGWPRYQQWRMTTAKLSRMQTADKIDDAKTDFGAKVQQATAQRADLTRRLDALKAQVKLVSRHEKNGQSANGKASEFEKALSLLESVPIQCTQIETIDIKQDQNSNLLATLKTLGKALGKSDHTSLRGQCYRLTLTGSFINLRSALHSLRVERDVLYVLGVEMENANPDTDQRTWFLTIYVS